MGRTFARFGTLLTGSLLARILLAGASCFPAAGCLLTPQAWSPPPAAPAIAPQPQLGAPTGEPGAAAPGGGPAVETLPPAGGVMRPLAPFGLGAAPERRLRVESDPRQPVPELGMSEPLPRSESGLTPLPGEQPVEPRGEAGADDPETESRSDRVPSGRPRADGAPGKAPDGGPEFRSPEPPPARPVELTVRSIAECLVDDHVVFSIALRNATGETLTGLRVEVAFDAGFVFPGSTETRVGRDIEALDPKGAHEFQLTLVAAKPGRHCCRFEVLKDSSEIATKSACVDIAPRKLSTSIVGPAERIAGSRAEFNVKLANASETPRQNVRVTVAYEPALRPVEWSNDAEQIDSRLSWKLGDLAPGEGAQVQVEFECQRASEETCITVFVSVDGEAPEKRTFCLRILPAGMPLFVEASDEDDPLTVGRQTSHVVRVHNRGLEAARDVAVMADVPLTLDVLAATAEIDGKATETQPAISGRQITFTAASLPADAVLVVRIRVQATTHGDDRTRVTVKSAGNEDVVTAEPTTVNPRPE